LEAEVGYRGARIPGTAAVDVVADSLVAVADVVSDGLHRPSGRVQGEDLLGSFSGQHEY
jgi:hypothetical protein